MLKGLGYWLRLAVLFCVAGFFLWLLLADHDLSLVADHLAIIPLTALLAALACLAVGYSFRIVRWWLLLRALDPHLPLSRPVWPFLVSIALNNVLPFRAGDAVRIFGFRRQLAAPASRIFGTVVVERLADLIFLAGVTALGLWVLGRSAGFEHWALAVIAILVVGLLGLVVTVMIAPWLIRFFGARSERDGLLGKLAVQAVTFLESLRVLRDWRLALLLIVTTALSWLFEGGVFVAVAAGIGIAADSYAPWFSLGAGTLGTLIPSTPGHVGTFDFLASSAMQAFAVPSEQAIAFAFAVHAVLWLPLTLLGLGYFLFTGGRLAMARSTKRGLEERG